MLVLGLLSFIQIVFIPGFILLEALKIKTANKLEFITYSFALSLILNYNLVYLFTLLKIYEPITVYVLFALEIAIISFFVFRKRDIFNRPFLDLSSLKRETTIRRILFVAASALSVFFFFFFFRNMGSIFTGWDPVFSWNRWAVDWYLNEIPLRTYLYPQMIPADFSISYQFMQDHYVQLFAKAFMPFFTIFITFLFISLYLIRKDPRLLVTSIIFSTIILVFGYRYIDSGYVDIAVAFLSFAAVYETLKGGKLTNKRIALILILASAAALTKFIGLLVFGYCLGWIIYNIIKGSSLEGRRPAAISIIAGITILELHWYLVKAVQISLGIEFSYIKFLTQDIHHELNIFERFFRGLNLFPLWAVIVFFILLFFVISSLFVKNRIRTVTLFLTIPFILAWGFYFSYDERNLLAAIPFMAISAAYGISLYFNKYITGSAREVSKPEPAEKGKKKCFFKNSYIAIISLIIFIALSVFLIVSREDIYSSQIQKQKELGDRFLNKRLYEYKENKQIEGKIITDYYWVTSLPGFEGSTIKTFKENDAFIIISNSDSYELVNPIELAGDDTFGFLISDIYYFRFYDSFQEKIRKNKFERIFDFGGYHFIKIN